MQLHHYIESKTTLSMSQSAHLPLEQQLFLLLADAHLVLTPGELSPIGDVGWCSATQAAHSNLIFLNAGDALVAIDHGASTTDTQMALTLLRKKTTIPIAAVICRHHTHQSAAEVICEEALSPQVDVYVAAKREPQDRAYGQSSNAASHNKNSHLRTHKPFQIGLHGRVSTTQIQQDCTVVAAGLDLHLQLRPALYASMPQSHLTIHIPQLGICIDDYWLAALPVVQSDATAQPLKIRPQPLLQHLRALVTSKPDYVVGSLGAPLHLDQHTEANAPSLLEALYETLKFIHDQTHRRLREGQALGDIIRAVQPPTHHHEHTLCQVLADHTDDWVQQVLVEYQERTHSPTLLLPPATPAANPAGNVGTIWAQRMIEGFGGTETVLEQISRALNVGDWRWAIHLSQWLILSPPQQAEHCRTLAGYLDDLSHTVHHPFWQHWCLAHSVQMNPDTPMPDIPKPDTRTEERHSASTATSLEPERKNPEYPRALTTHLIPEIAADLDCHIAWHFSDGRSEGLHLRRQVATITGGGNASHHLTLSLETWQQLVEGDLSLADAAAEGTVSLVGDLETFHAAFAALGLNC